ncbi:MAG: DUF1045 domain-containing protein [Burkholderiales bacterium]|nr:DUF1045 domain-containing protein [Burkholderiales bacterium]
MPHMPSQTPRYALYFAPETGSAWWIAGCRWLGRDPATMQTLAQPALSGITPAVQQALTRQARRYGFHATLKAPFRLAPGCSAAGLEQALAAFCARQSPLSVPAPQVQWMGRFLALRPGADSAELDALAQACVSAFDRFRAPPGAAEPARRRQAALSPRQQQLLQRWGYPYTEEEFRFHLTLSDPIPEHCAAWQAAASMHFQSAPALSVSAIALFCEAAPGADFQLLRQFRFGETSA